MSISPGSLRIACVLFIAFITQATFAQTGVESLRKNIQKILNTTRGKVGVAIMSPESGDSLTFYNETRFPMQSVYKFPLAMAILHLVDEGKLRLDQKIHVGKAEMHSNTWSPLREKYPDGNVGIPLSELLAYTVSQSDNNGCDVLFRLAGGTQKVDQYIKKLGVEQISIAATEYEMHQAWDVQYTNWCKPWAMLQLLDIFHKGETLSKSSHDFLWKIMTETSTGLRRIKGLLPEGTVVAHKTGTSGSNSQGITAATNDAGVVKLPNGKSFIIVVFVTDSKEKDEVREDLIARISKAAWDHYSAK